MGILTKSQIRVLDLLEQGCHIEHTRSCSVGGKSKGCGRFHIVGDGRRQFVSQRTFDALRLSSAIAVLEKTPTVVLWGSLKHCDKPDWSSVSDRFRVMSQNSWFPVDQRVIIHPRFREDYRDYVRDNTYGSESDVFVVVGYYPGFMVNGYDESPACYSVTPEGKQFSAVMIEEEHLLNAETGEIL